MYGRKWSVYDLKPLSTYDLKPVYDSHIWFRRHMIPYMVDKSLEMSNDLIMFYQGFLYTTNDSYKTNDFNTWKSNDLNQRYSTMTTNGSIVASND